MKHSSLLRRIDFRRWFLPISLVVFVLLYQLIAARWDHDTLSELFHFTAEVLLFATAGPVAAFLTLTQIKQWVSDKEQAEAQARANERWSASITAASADIFLTSFKGLAVQQIESDASEANGPSKLILMTFVSTMSDNQYYG